MNASVTSAHEENEEDQLDYSSDSSIDYEDTNINHHNRYSYSHTQSSLNNNNNNNNESSRRRRPVRLTSNNNTNNSLNNNSNTHGGGGGADREEEWAVDAASPVIYRFASTTPSGHPGSGGTGGGSHGSPNIVISGDGGQATTGGTSEAGFAMPASPANTMDAAFVFPSHGLAGNLFFNNNSGSGGGGGSPHGNSSGPNSNSNNGNNSSNAVGGGGSSGSDKSKGGSESNDLATLAQLVHYTPADLLTRAYPLVPVEVKTAAFPPYKPLPAMPDVLGSRFGETSQAAHFMCCVAVELSRRVGGATLAAVDLRSLLVGERVASLRAAAAVREASDRLAPLGGRALLPAWDDYTDHRDRSDNSNSSSSNSDEDEDEDEMFAESYTSLSNAAAATVTGGDGSPSGAVERASGAVALKHPVFASSTAGGGLTAADFTVALTAPGVAETIPLHNLELLLGVLRRCVSTQDLAALCAWGPQHLLQVVYRQLSRALHTYRQDTTEGSEAARRAADKWIGCAFSILFYGAVYSENLCLLLAVLRLSYRHERVLSPGGRPDANHAEKMHGADDDDEEEEGKDNEGGLLSPPPRHDGDPMYRRSKRIRLPRTGCLRRAVAAVHGERLRLPPPPPLHSAAWTSASPPYSRRCSPLAAAPMGSPVGVTQGVVSGSQGDGDGFFSLAGVIGDPTGAVRGLCILEDEGRSTSSDGGAAEDATGAHSSSHSAGACVLLTDSGALRLTLAPPYAVTASSDYGRGGGWECRGMVVERSRDGRRSVIAVRGGDGLSVDLLDADTLEFLETLHATERAAAVAATIENADEEDAASTAPSSSAGTHHHNSSSSGRQGFYLYAGGGRFVQPYMPAAGRRLLLSPGLPVEGRLEPSALPLPRPSDPTLSIQFRICPVSGGGSNSGRAADAEESELVLLSLFSSDGTEWASVRLRVCPREGSLSLHFSHTAGAVAAVAVAALEPGRWSLWSASLVAVRGELASWAVLRDGAPYTCEGKAGVARPPLPATANPNASAGAEAGSAVSAEMLKGSFAGYVGLLQLWLPGASPHDMRVAAVTGGSPSRGSGTTAAFVGVAEPQLSFPMTEGVGCSLYHKGSALGTRWVGDGVGWQLPPPDPRETAAAAGSGGVLWRPPLGSEYTVTTNGAELAVIEPDRITWVSAADGQVLEQGATPTACYSAARCYYYCPASGRVASLDPEARCLHLRRVRAVPCAVLSRLPSMAAPAHGAAGESARTAAGLAALITHQLNACLLTGGGSGLGLFGSAGDAPLRPRAVGRLLAVCVEVTERLESRGAPAAESSYPTHLLALCGRLLTRQVALLRRRTPVEFVKQIVALHTRLRALEGRSGDTNTSGGGGRRDPALAEAAAAVAQLHAVALSECISPAYQLQLANDEGGGGGGGGGGGAARARELLRAERVPALVEAVARAGERRALMTFLNHLREACAAEAGAALRGDPGAAGGPTSPLMLGAVVGLLSVAGDEHWQLIAIALLDSLTRSVLEAWEASGAPAERLRDTAIGTVVFPAAHYLRQLRLRDPGIALRALEALDSTRARLKPHLLSSHDPSDPTELRQTEMHPVLPPPKGVAATVVLRLPHATRIRLELTGDRRDGQHGTAAAAILADVRVSLLNNTYWRSGTAVPSGNGGGGGGGGEGSTPVAPPAPPSAASSGAPVMMNNSSNGPAGNAGGEAATAAAAAAAGGGGGTPVASPSAAAANGSGGGGAAEVCFHEGGQLFIAFGESFAAPPGCRITVHAETTVRVSAGHWIADLCLALGHAAVAVTHHTRLALTAAGGGGQGGGAGPIARDSFLRGGLSRAALEQHGMAAAAAAGSTSAEEEEEEEEERRMALEVAAAEREGEKEEEEEAAVLMPLWREAFRQHRGPQLAGFERLARWVACALAWHSTRGSASDGGEADIASVLPAAAEWVLQRKAFLLLEAVQQRRAEAIIARARFLLTAVRPRGRAEAALAAAQPAAAEEPVNNNSGGGGGGLPSRAVSRSRANLRSVRASAVDLSSVQLNSMGITARRAARGAKASHLFSRALGEGDGDGEGTTAQVLEFLVHGPDDTGALLQHLVACTQQARIGVSTYQLQEELCGLYYCDRDGMFAAILSAHLRYRQQQAAGRRRAPGKAAAAAEEAAAATTSEWDGFGYHYMQSVIGCGLQRELEVQKAQCAFVQAALRMLLKHLADSDDPFPFLESIDLCAVLCHPWDAVDMSILEPKDIFAFLRRVLAAALELRLRHSRSEVPAEAKFTEHKGLFDLLHKALVIPNALLPIAEDGVNVISGDSQGLHVENKDITCCARLHWRPFTKHAHLRLPRDCGDGTDTDVFANYGLACVVSELPDVQYFEVTLDLSVHERPVALGLSGVPIAPRELKSDDTAFYFSSDGTAHSPDRGAVRLCEPWCEGDTVGCGVFAPTNSIFFTRNGDLLGVIGDSALPVLIPFVEARAAGTLIKLIVNYGQEEPFVFDISSLHSSCRTRYVTTAAVCDTVIITTHYLVNMCYRNLSAAAALPPAYRGAVGSLLQWAVAFLDKAIAHLLEQLANSPAEDAPQPQSTAAAAPAATASPEARTSRETIIIVLSQLFHCVNAVIECFAFDGVAPETHRMVVRLCVLAVTTAKDRWVCVRAAQSLIHLREILCDDSLHAAADALAGAVTAEAVVERLTELARVRVLRGTKAAGEPPRFMGRVAVVSGKGSFYGSAPLPATGRTTVGFRLQRQGHPGLQVGAALGGCYYVGLSTGLPQITNMSQLTKRTDMYVLQDVDDPDQVPGMLIAMHCIPRNSYKRVYGIGEPVWVELNADAGEVTFYRGDKMTLIGLAFANIRDVSNLYPFVFLFNEDASCEILPPPPSRGESTDYWASHLRRSVAVRALQQLHLVPYFAPAITALLRRSIGQLERSLDRCLVALAVLGSERQSMYSRHGTYGLVVVVAIAAVTRRAVVRIAGDEDKRLISVAPETLEPSFVQAPLYLSGGPEAVACAEHLAGELGGILYDALRAAPLLREEQEARAALEAEFAASLEETAALDLVALLRAPLAPPAAAECVFSPALRANSSLGSSSAADARNEIKVRHTTPHTIATAAPVVVERRHSSSGVYCPNPSTAVVPAPAEGGCALVVCGPILDCAYTVSVALSCPGGGASVLYVGLTTAAHAPPEQVEDVALWEDAWPLCSVDSVATNSRNCCVEPGMLFGGGDTLYGDRDILCMHVNRADATVSFSVVRRGRRTDFGVLFEGVPAEAALRPFIAVGAELTAVFSFVDTVGILTFPARQTYPACGVVPTGRPDGTACAVCETALTPPFYSCSEEGTVFVCDFCFRTWQLPRALFSLARAPDGAPPLPAHLVSRNTPARLEAGALVEFEENTVLKWLARGCVNAECKPATCVATRDEAVVATEPLSACSDFRVDVLLGHLAGVPGCPFSGLLPFTPMWHQSGVARPSCTVAEGSLAVSCSAVPPRSKALFSLHLRAPAAPAGGSGTLNCAGLFVGVTTLTEGDCPAAYCSSERLSSGSDVWGTWCGSKEKISHDGDIFVLVDGVSGSLLLSSTLAGLYYHPFVVTWGGSGRDDPRPLRPLIFSRSSSCVVSAGPGTLAQADPAEPSHAPVVLALVPQQGSSSDPVGALPAEALVLLDTIYLTDTLSATPWRFTELAESDPDGILFRVDDTVTLRRAGAEVQVYRQGLLLATAELAPSLRAAKLQTVLCFPIAGMCACLVPPLYGRTLTGRVVSTHGSSEVAVVEYTGAQWTAERAVVRRKDVRHCAPSLQGLTVREGARIAFLSGGSQRPKRGTVLGPGETEAMVNICEADKDGSVMPTSRAHCFSLENEGAAAAHQLLYSLLTPPTSTVTKVFEVGKTRYRFLSKASYNGIMFECSASDAVTLTGLHVLSLVSGKHKAEVFYRKGTFRHHERDARGWTVIFSRHVEMTAERQFAVSFTPIPIEAGATFSLYVNTSNNCGVGFYGEGDNMKAGVGEELDSDGTITVYAGVKSGSSTAFGEFSTNARGFCGSIVYKQNKGSKPPLMEWGDSPVVAAGGPVEGDRSSEARTSIGAARPADRESLVCRPAGVVSAEEARFTVDVLKPAVDVISLRVPVVVRGGREGLVGLHHAVVSVHCAPAGGESGAGEKKEEEREEALRWRWCWNCRVQLDDTGGLQRIAGEPLRLREGRYHFRILVLYPTVGEGTDLCLLAADTASTSTSGSGEGAAAVQNHLLRVRGLFGDVEAELAASEAFGAAHTFATGALLSRTSSPSYNGIMFDIRASRDLVLEEVLCVSQTTADRVTVQAFWKEGSMEGAESSPAMWKELMTKELSLVDKEEFSPGPLRLTMKANQTYALYINTSSSCGVLFYTGSDGFFGNVGEEFDHDEMLTVFIGRKSESATPFREVSVEPRAFRGKLRYRECLLAHGEVTDQALFSYLRAFVVTRMLVALTSFVDSFTPPADTAVQGFFQRLLSSVMPLVVSSGKSVADLNEAEGLLATLLRNSFADLATTPVRIPLPRSGTALPFATFTRDDLALRADDDGSTSLVTVLEDDTALDEHAVLCVSSADKRAEPYAVPVRQLLPVARCLACRRPYASRERCSATGGPHCPAEYEENRVVDSLAELVKRQYGLPAAAAHDAAKELLLAPAGSLAREMLHSDTNNNNNNNNNNNSTLTAQQGAGGEVTLRVPQGQLLCESGSARPPLLCPFVFHGKLGALVSLLFVPRADRVEVSFVTDYPLRHGSSTTGTPWTLRLTLAAPGGQEIAAHRDTSPLVFIASARLTTAVVALALTLTPSLCAAAAHPDGGVRFVLRVEPLTDPLVSLVTPPVPAPPPRWVWADGGVERELHTHTVAFLDDAVFALPGPPAPRTCQLTAVTSGGAGKAIFLEVHVVQRQRQHSYRRAPPPSTTSRKPFAVANGETLTLTLTTDGDLFICSADDMIRCRVTREELGGGTGGSGEAAAECTHRVGFVCGSPSQESVRARLHAPEAAPPRDDRGPETPFGAPAAADEEKADTYSPQWVTFAADAVTVSRNRMTASCAGEASGPTVLGTPLPDAGVTSFIVHVDRRDRPPGAPLTGGHFVGVALASLPVAETLKFDAVKRHVGQVWAVQDLQDGDSMPNQAAIPPMAQDTGGSGRSALYCSATRLLFVVDRTAGTLSLARDAETPRIIFNDIPKEGESNIALCPFARLDNNNASATLVRFSHGALYERLQQPLLERAVLAQPVTPSLLRRFPLANVLRVFPVLEHIVARLPAHHAAEVERHWGANESTSRLHSRVTRVLMDLIAAGACERRFMLCDPTDAALAAVLGGEPVAAAVRALSRSSDACEIAVFPARCPGEAPAVFTLPRSYELLGWVPNTHIMRLLHVDATGLSHRTLHAVYLDDPRFNLSPCDSVVPHPACVRQREILLCESGAPACAVIFDGWFDCTLADVIGYPLPAADERRVAVAVAYALEHWHLHGLVHGHLIPQNVYLSMATDRGDVTRVALWDAWFMGRADPWAPPELHHYGTRDAKGDRWSLSKMLEAMSAELQRDTDIATCVRRLQNGADGLTAILSQSTTFSTLEDASGGPTFHLHTGATLKDCAGSYNGVMFDVVAKRTAVRLTKVSFVPDTNGPITVRLFARAGTFIGFECQPSEWKKVYEKQLDLRDGEETFVEGFSPLLVEAESRVGLFLHTTSRCGVHFYSEAQGITASIGQVGEENNDIGITVGKKSESNVPFESILNQKRLLKGCIAYTVLTRSHSIRSGLNATPDDDDGRTREVAVYAEGKGYGFLLEERGAEGLVLLQSQRTEWVPASDYRECSYAEMTAQMEALCRYAESCRVQSSWLSILEHVEWRYPVHSVRPMQFFAIGEQGSGSSPLDESAGVCAFTIQCGGAWWLSEPVTRTTAVSLSLSNPRGGASVFAVQLDRDSLLSCDVWSVVQQCLDATPAPANLLTPGQPHRSLDLCFDEDRQCVSRVEEGGAVVRQQRASGSFAQRPFFLLVGAASDTAPLSSPTSPVAEAGSAAVVIHAQACMSAASAADVAPLGGGAALVRLPRSQPKENTSLFPNGAARPHFGVGPLSVAVRAPARGRRTPRLEVYSLASTPAQLSLVALPEEGIDGGSVVAVGRLGAERVDADEALLCECPGAESELSLLLVQARSGCQWAEQKVALSVHPRAGSGAVEVAGARARQVARSGEGGCGCVVASPSFGAAEIHEVRLRLVFPRTRPIRMLLERNAGNSAGSLELPFGFDLHAREQCFQSRLMVEVVVHLSVNFFSRQILLFCPRYGTATAVRAHPQLAPENPLTFYTNALGSTVEVLSWRSASPRADLTPTTHKIRGALHVLSTPVLSTNTIVSVGAITRHSAKGNRGNIISSCGSEGAQHPAARMCTLIISYARVLLEKSLLAQESARAAVARQMHHLLSYTSIRYSSAIASVVDREFHNRSFDLLAQCCAYLLLPSSLQAMEGVESAVHVITASVGDDAVRALLKTDFAPMLTIALLHTATAYSRNIRHKALQCAQEIIKCEAYPLPAHNLLAAHLGPLLAMVGALCTQRRMSSAVVQIGVLLVADLVKRYAVARPSLAPPGLRSSIPYPIILTARAIIGALTSTPPQPLPSAVEAGRPSRHHISCRLISKESQSGLFPCYGIFTEENREDGVKTMEVVINENRRGSVMVGWEVATVDPLEAKHLCESLTEPLPYYGCVITATASGSKATCCVQRAKARASDMRELRVSAGDVVTIQCHFGARKVIISIRGRSEEKVSWTISIPTTHELGLPFFYAQSKADATLICDGLAGTRRCDEMCAELARNPEGKDTLAPESFDFYAELNAFLQQDLGQERRVLLMLQDEPLRIPAYELASYVQISRVVRMDALGDEDMVSLAPLLPYAERLQVFDALTASFAPLLNLQRRSELLVIFGYLKSLCSKETETRIQNEVMRPFQNRAGKKMHVTIHTMQAQPSLSRGAHQTLVRSIFGQLYFQLRNAPIEMFNSTPMFGVKLAGFGSTDAGGPYREILSQLATEIMTPHPSGLFQMNPLFMDCGRGDDSAVMPNPYLLDHSQTPLMLGFLGKLLGAFFLTSDLLAVELPPLFWKQLLGERTSVQDLTALDPDIVRLLAPRELMRCSLEELEERFPGIGATWETIAQRQPASAHCSADLPPTTIESAHLLSETIVSRELGRFAEAVGHIQQGFDQVVPLYVLQAFRRQKVEAIVCGSKKLSFAALSEECDIMMPTVEKDMFLAVLESMTDEDRTLLLRFTTGQSRLPLKSRIKVQHGGPKNSLPTSSTCFFTLRIPSYTSKEKMKEKLLYAARQCNAIDADGQARENLFV